MNNISTGIWLKILKQRNSIKFVFKIDIIFPSKIFQISFQIKSNSIATNAKKKIRKLKSFIQFNKYLLGQNPIRLPGCTAWNGALVVVKCAERYGHKKVRFNKWSIEMAY